MELETFSSYLTEWPLLVNLYDQMNWMTFSMDDKIFSRRLFYKEIPEEVLKAKNSNQRIMPVFRHLGFLTSILVTI